MQEKLEKAILERADALSRSKSLECSLQMAQNELKRFEEQTEQHKQEIQQLVESLDEQRSRLADFELKYRVRNCFILVRTQIDLILQDSQTRCADLENERQRIQIEFEAYYQRMHQLEELQAQQQQKALLNNNTEEIHQVASGSLKYPSLT